MSFFFTDLTSSKTTLLSSLCVPRTHWQYPRPFLASRTQSPSLAPIHILPSLDNFHIWTPVFEHLGHLSSDKPSSRHAFTCTQDGSRSAMGFLGYNLMSKMRISLIPQLVCCTVLITPPVMLRTRAAMPRTIHFLTTFHQFACLSASFLITQFHLLSNFYHHSAPMSIFVCTCIPIC